VPITAIARGLSSSEAEIPDDFVLDYPDLEDAEIPEGLALDWPDLEDTGVPEGLALDWPDVEDTELADLAPADPGSPEAGVREVLKAGRWDRARGDGGGFAAGGVADHLPAGSVLAGFAGDAWAAGLGRLNDDELIGVMRAARRLTSWAAAMELAAMGDLWRRRVTEEQAGDTDAACHADDEIAAALTLTGRAADRVLDLAIALRRLPLTSQALAAGDIDLPRAMVIADEVTGLDGEHATAVEHAVAGSAPGQTTGQLRAATRRAVLAADPSAARQRKERAQQDARVERWDEHAGTAALAGRDLPPASVLAADQNLTALARQLKAAGVPGTMDTLRAEAFLALLSGTSIGALLPGGLSMPREPANDGGPAGRGLHGDFAARALPITPAGFARAAAPPGFSGDSGAAAFPVAPGDLARPAFPRPGDTLKLSTGLSSTIDQSPGLSGTVDQSPGLSSTVDQSPGLSGTVNLTMPMATWLGLSDAPGNASGYGPLDASDSRDLAHALAVRAGNRWCLTFTDARGRPVAHGCARDGPADERRHGDRPDARGRAGPRSRSHVDSTGDRWTFTITLLPGNACEHAWQTAAYQPSRALRHLVETRHDSCVFPGCRRPATRCDKDHTVPYDQGGKTCLCNLAPLCRRHHRAKQARGWALKQISPGILSWTTPSGRHYVV
jgi:HNH endonuclease